MALGWSVLPPPLNPGANGHVLSELASGCCLAVLGGENAGVIEVVGRLPRVGYSEVKALEERDSRVVILNGRSGESFCAVRASPSEFLCTIDRNDYYERIYMRGGSDDIAFFTDLAARLAGVKDHE